jgi:DNA repair protein RadD
LIGKKMTFSLLDFLDKLDDAELARLAALAIGFEAHCGSEDLSKKELQLVLFSAHSFDLLRNTEVRRSLISSLSDCELAELAETCKVAWKGKRSEVELHIRAKSWSEASGFARGLCDILSVPEAFFPVSKRKELRAELCFPTRRVPPLFDYQEEIIQKLLDLNLCGTDRALAQLPTGAGKTRVATEFLVQELLSNSCAGIFWLAHSAELCQQALEAFREMWRERGDKPIKLWKCWGSGNMPNDAPQDGFAVSTFGKFVQIVASSHQKSRLNLDQAIIVVDEAHKAIAPKLGEALDKLSCSTRVPILGLTATPGRGKELSSGNRELAKFFQGRLIKSEILGNQPYETLRRRGILAAVNRQVLPWGSASGNVDSGTMDALMEFPASSLKALGQNRKRNQAIVAAIKSEVVAGGRVLVFSCSVKHSRLLARLVACEGVPVTTIDGEMNSGARDATIAAFKNGGIPVLINFGILSTGFDLPAVNALIISRPTNSVVLYGQMVGRGLRGPAVGGGAQVNIFDLEDQLPGFGGLDGINSVFQDYWD